MKAFDVAIVGGGVVGASIAFELAAEKLRIVLLDKQQPGREASFAAAGMLSPAPHTSQDLPLVPLAKESLTMYPQFVASIEEASGKTTAFAREGTLEILFGSQSEPDRDEMVAEHRRLGLAAEPITVDAARRMEKSISAAACAAAWLPDECTIEPRLLMDAVLTAAQRQGVEIRPGCLVTSLLNEHNRCTGVVADGGEKIEAKQVIVAAGCFSGTIGRERASAIATESVADHGADVVGRYAPTHPVRGQMLALRTESALLKRVLRSHSGYLVPRADGRIVAGSTLENAGFDKAVTRSGMQQILDAASELLPALAHAIVVESWAGLRPGTPDNLPILGPTDIQGLTIATGHYRNGILLAPITAKLIREWITCGHVSFDAATFSPLRFRDPKSRARQDAPRQLPKPD